MAPSNLFNLYLTLAATAAPPPGEGGFEHYYKDFLVLEPVPWADWVCGETVSITWNMGHDLADGATTLPAAPASGLVNIHLAKANGVSGPVGTKNLTKLTIAVDVPIDDQKVDFKVDCAQYSALCPECLDADGGLLTDEGYLNHKWDYLLFEDVDLLANPDDGCSMTGLNYDNDNCWSVRSEGAVNVATEVYKNGLIEDFSDVNIFQQKFGWRNEGSPPLNNHLWGMAVTWSHRASFYTETDDVVDLPYDYGTWDVTMADFRGVIGQLVAKSRSDNIITVAIRPTTIGPYSYDDWMTNFSISQRACTDVLAGCQDNMKFHRGFLYEYMQSRDAIRQAVVDILKDPQQPCAADDPSSWRILFTGMSQGAGIANIAMFDLYHYLDGHPDVPQDVYDRIKMMVYHVGGPVSGNEHYALWMENNTEQWQRDRFVNRFDIGVLLEDGSPSYRAGPLRIDDLDVAGVSIMDFDQVVDCENATPPLGADTPPYAGWAWKTAEELGNPEMTEEELSKANAVSWQDGDLVTLMRSSTDCKGFSAGLNLDSRFTAVKDPVFMHFDPDLCRQWCTAEGCEATCEFDPPHPNSKGPTRLSTAGMLAAEGMTPLSCHNTAGPSAGSGLGCHHTGMYAHGIAMLRNNVDLVDHIQFRSGGEDFAGCKHTGAIVSQPQTTYIPPELTAPATDAPESTEEYTTGSGSIAWMTAALTLCGMLALF